MSVKVTKAQSMCQVLCYSRSRKVHKTFIFLHYIALPLQVKKSLCAVINQAIEITVNCHDNLWDSLYFWYTENYFVLL